MSARIRVIFLAVSLAGSIAANSTRAVPTLPGLTGASWVIADFNGDGQLDVLFSSPENFGQSDSLHRIELRLGSGSAVHSSFQVRGVSRGLNLFARDVDGDHDLDLVITSGFSNLPVGVWLNDGQGVFTQGDASAYSLTIWNAFDPSLARLPAFYRNLCAVREQRPADALPPGFTSAPLPSSSEGNSSRPSANLPYSNGRQFSSRAPPPRP